tara:strand:+ start:2687 stop:3460 length:774 start_codon:yes stop_codon:yes gene_type:complete
MKKWFDDFLNKSNIEFSKDELNRIEFLKSDYANRLYERFTDDYEMFDFETSTHPTSASKINALERIKQSIENGKIFDKSYFDILSLNGATVHFNDQRFIEFAISYSILNHDAEQTAFIVLIEIWQVHLLNLIILEYDKKKVTLATNYFKINMNFDDRIFPNVQSHQFFLLTVNRDEFEVKRNWISQLYRILKSLKFNGKHEIYIKSNEFEFADYWNGHELEYEIKKHEKGIGLDGGKPHSVQNKLIESWYKEYIMKL